MQIGAFLAGALVGALVGILVISPALRAGLIIREHRRASRQAELTDELLRRMAHDADHTALPLDPH